MVIISDHERVYTILAKWQKDGLWSVNVCQLAKRHFILILTIKYILPICQYLRMWLVSLDIGPYKL